MATISLQASGPAGAECAAAPPGPADLRRCGVRQSKTLLLYMVLGILSCSLLAFLVLEAVQGIIIAVGVTEKLKVPLVILLPVLLRAFGQVLTYAIPLALLLGAGFFIGRLNADREILALKSSGVSPLQLTVPAFLLGGAFSAFCLYINQTWVPDIRASLCNLQALIASQLSALGEGWNLEFSPTSGQTIWIYHHDGPFLEGIFVGISGGSSDGPFSAATMSRVDAPSYPCYLFAERGFVSARESEGGSGVEVVLRNVSVFLDNDFLSAGPKGRRDPATRDPATRDPATRDPATQGQADPPSDFMHMIHFDSLRWSLRFSKEELRPKYLSFRALEAEKETWRQKVLASEALGTPEEIDRNRREYSFVLTEFHSRLAISFCAVTFPLAALALGLSLRSSNRLLPFFLATTVVPAVYFPLELVGNHFAALGFLPWASEELGNAALLAVCFFFLRRAHRLPRG